MGIYVKGTQNHLDIVPAGPASAYDVVPAAECPNAIAVYTRPVSAADISDGRAIAAAYTGIFRFLTALDTVLVGTKVDILSTGDGGQGTAVAGTVGGVGGICTKAVPATGVTQMEVAINVNTDSMHV